MIDGTALLALKNAWNGAVAAADRVRDLSPQVSAIGDAADLAPAELDTYHQVSLAHEEFYLRVENDLGHRGQCCKRRSV